MCIRDSFKAKNRAAEHEDTASAYLAPILLAKFCSNLNTAELSLVYRNRSPVDNKFSISDRAASGIGSAWFIFGIFPNFKLPQSLNSHNKDNR